MKILQKIALVLTIIGALNWGMVGLFEIDIIASLFDGSDSIISKIIYIIVAIAGIINIGLLFDHDEIAGIILDVCLVFKHEWMQGLIPGSATGTHA